jgi:C-5 cytosine-specific DNA methylase
LWFTKSRRAQSKDDYETWIQGGVVPTLNVFDNNGDTRATVIIIMRNREGKPGGGKGPMLGDKSFTLATSNDQNLFIFYGNRVGDIRMQEDVINTLQARMGTGGGNVPIMAHPIQGNMIGRNDNAGPQGKGYGEETDPMFSLTSTDRHAVAFDLYNQRVTEKNQTLSSSATDASHQGAIWKDSIVRRLTPVECERLQGFPDNWTDEQPDSARYKQMGNAVAVPVAEWILKNLVETI